MKAPSSFHPPLFALAIPLTVFSANVSIVPFSEMLLPTVITVLAAIASWGIAYSLLKDVERSASAASLFVLAFFTYSDGVAFLSKFFGGAESTFNTSVHHFAWIGLSIALVAAAGWKARYSKGLNMFLNVVGVSMAALSIFGAAQAVFAQSAWKPSAKRASAIPDPSKSRADLFYIILDGYGGEEPLKKFYGFDNAPFIAALKSRGFHVADDARTNFCQTELSMASTLNLTGIEGMPRPQSNFGYDRLALDRMIDESRVSQILRDEGFAYLAVTSGFQPLQFDTADHVFEKPTAYSPFIDALVAKTPIRFGKASIQSQFRSRRTELLGALDTLASIGSRSASPRFIVAHIFAPHPPFVFGPNGEEVESEMVYGIWDGSHYVERGGSREGYRKRYSGQIAYLNKKLLDTIDAIIAKNPSAMIVLQGDHGPKAELDHNSLEKTNLDEVFPILLATRADESIQAKLELAKTPLATMRTVIGSMSDKSFEIVKDRSYFSTWEAPLKFVDVTDRLNN